MLRLARRMLSRKARGGRHVAPAVRLLTLNDLRRMPDRVTAEAATRARCMVAPVEGTTALCRALGRFKFYVDTRDIGIAPHLMIDGYWELWITEFILRNLRPGQVALDLGANLGYYSILMADIVGAEGRVVAFEPNPNLHRLLRMNTEVNGFWHTLDARAVAIGDRCAAAVPFLAPIADPKNGRVIADDSSALAGFDGQRAERMTVPMQTLDEAINGPVHFAKIDVEGSEEAVWNGMQQLIARSPDIGIVLEFNPARCERPAEALKGIAQRFPLRRIGFDGYARSCTEAEVLAEKEDTILYLSRHAPR